MATTINSTSITTNTISGGIDVVTGSGFNDFHGLKSYTIITQTGSSTYTKPSGINWIKVFVTAGGGGGGSHNSDDAQGGGGAGGTAIKIIDARSLSTVSCTVGTGGARGIGSTSTSSSGSVSSFGSYCSATAGSGVPTWGKGGRGGVGVDGDLNLYGGDGHTGNIDGSGNSEAGGNGGSSYWGGGPTGASHWGARETPQNWGNGGAGSHASSNNEGTDGKQGVIVVEEYV